MSRAGQEYHYLTHSSDDRGERIDRESRSYNSRHSSRHREDSSPVSGGGAPSSYAKHASWRSPSRGGEYRDERHRGHLRRSQRGRPSASRSPSATRKKRRQWRFDSPPKAEGALGDAGGSVSPSSQGGGRVSNFSTAPGPASSVPGVIDSWILGACGSEAVTPAEFAQLARTMNLTAEGAKAARELYIGNLPPGVDVNQLIEFLNAALLALRLNVMPGSPVVKSWISTDGHFAFVEFRTMEEASAGMQLNGLNCLGYNLRIGRPKTYPAELAVITQKLEDAARLRMASSVSCCVDGSNGITVGGSLTSGSAAASAAILAAAAANGSAPLPPAPEPGRIPSSPQEAALAAKQAAVALGLANHMPLSGLGGMGFTAPHTERLVLINMPYTLDEQRTRELLTAFGALKSFIYVKNPKASESSSNTGRLIGAYEEEENSSTTAPDQSAANTVDIDSFSAMCCFEYEDIAHGAQARAALDDLKICDRILTLVEASDGVSRGILTEYFSNSEAAAAIAGAIMRSQIPTRVVMLSNLTQSEELVDDKEYAEIVDDVRTECSEIDEVVSVEIPRPVRGFNEDEVDQTGVGFAFVKMTTIEGANRVRKTLGGRKFGGRVVEASYFSETKFARRDFSQPQPNYNQEDSSLYNSALADDTYDSAKIGTASTCVRANDAANDLTATIKIEAPHPASGDLHQDDDSCGYFATSANTYDSTKMATGENEGNFNSIKLSMEQLVPESPNRGGAVESCGEEFELNHRTQYEMDDMTFSSPVNMSTVVGTMDISST